MKTQSTQSSYERDYSRRHTDSASPDAKGLLILMGVGVICLAAWAYGVVQFADWMRK